MPTPPSSFNLVQLTRTLQDQQQQYAQATAALARTLEEQRDQQRKAADAIADTLRRIGGLLSALLGALLLPHRHGQPPRPNLRSPRPSRPLRAWGAATPKRSSTSRPAKVETSGTDSLLAFIRRRGNPTSAELAAHWKSEGLRRRGQEGLGPPGEAQTAEANTDPGCPREPLRVAVGSGPPSTPHPTRGQFVHKSQLVGNLLSQAPDGRGEGRTRSACTFRQEREQAAFSTGVTHPPYGSQNSGGAPSRSRRRSEGGCGSA